MTNPAKPSALFAGTAEPDQGRCTGSLGGSRHAERCSGVFRRLRKPRKPWSGWSGNRWDTERNLSGKVKADRRAGEGAREWSEAEWKELARPGVPGDCGVWRGTQWSEKSDNAQKLFNHLLSMMLAGDSGKGHQQAVGFCVHPSRLTHKAGGVDTDNG